jgi:translation initiation factor IF-3
LGPYGHPDAAPRLIGRGLNVMVSPLPRNKRAKNPRETDGSPPPTEPSIAGGNGTAAKPLADSVANASPGGPDAGPGRASSGFSNNPFSELDRKLGAA